MTMLLEEEQYLIGHRMCVVTTLRKDGAPQSTPVAVLGELAVASVSVGESYICGVTTSGAA